MIGLLVLEVVLHIWLQRKCNVHFISASIPFIYLIFVLQLFDSQWTFDSRISNSVCSLACTCHRNGKEVCDNNCMIAQLSDYFIITLDLMFRVGTVLWWSTSYAVNLWVFLSLFIFCREIDSPLPLHNHHNHHLIILFSSYFFSHFTFIAMIFFSVGLQRPKSLCQPDWLLWLQL